MDSLHDDCLFGVAFSFFYIQLNTEIAYQEWWENKGRVKYIEIGAQYLNEEELPTIFIAPRICRRWWLLIWASKELLVLKEVKGKIFGRANGE